MRPFQEPQFRILGLDNDIWSLGCMLSELVVWLGLGKRGVDEYSRDRHREHAKMGHFDKSGYEYCFHDGENALKSVGDAHKTALGRLPLYDTLTPKICDLIQREMLVKSPLRDNADQVAIKLEALLGPEINIQPFHNEGVHAPSTATTRKPNDVFLPPNASNSERRPGLDPLPVTGRLAPTISQPALVMRPRQNSWRLSMTPIRANSPSPSHGESYHQLLPDEVTVKEVLDHQAKGLTRDTLPGYQEFCEEMMGKRHFLLLIDDSPSMSRYQDHVNQAVKAFTWLLEDHETDRVEVRFLSKPSQSHFHKPPHQSRLHKLKNWRNTKKGLVDIVEHVEKSLRERFDGGSGSACKMEQCLNAIFGEDKMVRHGKPTSVYVLTNGIWGNTPGERGKVAASIQELIAKMKRREMTRTEFCIQFVRYGNDVAAIEKLTYLDDMAKDFKDGAEDIVDHKYHESEIWAMMIGALDDGRDNPNASAAVVGHRGAEDRDDAERIDGGSVISKQDG